MTDWHRTLFDHYAAHYHAMEKRERLPDDLERLKRDRLPRWIHETPRTARVLDAGCAEGHWLEALRRVGFKNLTGVDLSAQLLEMARGRLGADARLFNADLCQWVREVPDSSFDVIFFHDVLEHLPREVTIPILREFHRILAPGGRLQVRVPNLACLIGQFFMALDFTHVTPFIEFSMLQVLEAAGFERARIRFESQAPRLFWSWRKPHRAVLRLANYARWQINRWLHRAVYLLNDFDFPRQFDPNLVVLAYK